MNAFTPNLLSLGDAQVVTSSDLVRHFGEWQDRAHQAPVYVQHRGRPRLVLVSVDMMSRLCAIHGDGAASDGARLSAVLDAVNALVAVIDGDLRISAISRRAARYFATDTGERAASLSTDVTAPLLDTALARVLTTGQDEVLDIVGPHGGRRLTLDIVADGDALIVVAHDTSAANELADARAEIDAGRMALGAIGIIAIAKIGLRGYLEGETRLLAKMTGIAQDALANVRFVTLFDIRSRVAIGDSIEAVINGATSLAVAGTLTVNHGPPKRVAVGLSPIRRQGTSVAVRAVIVEQPSASVDAAITNGA